MDISWSVPWLLELGMEEPRLTYEIEMDALDIFAAQNLTDALVEDFQHSFNSESNSSSAALIPKSNSTTNFINIETPHATVERPVKQQKHNNISTTQNVLNPETSSLVLSFSNLNSSTNSQKSPKSLLGTVSGKDDALSSGDLSFLSNILVSQDSSYVNQDNATNAGKWTKRKTPTVKQLSQPEDHVLAERKRREKIAQCFIALSAIVPGLKKIDKASVLGETIKHMKQLQERVKTLEEQTTNKEIESVVIIKKSQVLQDDKIFSNKSPDGHSSEQLPEIEARVSENNVLLRIHCDNQEGVLGKTLTEIEKLNLTVLNTCVMPFGNLALDITIIAKMEGESCMAAKDLVRSLLSAFT